MVMQEDPYWDPYNLLAVDKTSMKNVYDQGLMLLYEVANMIKIKLLKREIGIIVSSNDKGQYFLKLIFGKPRVSPPLTRTKWNRTFYVKDTQSMRLMMININFGSHLSNQKSYETQALNWTYNIGYTQSFAHLGLSVPTDVLPIDTSSVNDVQGLREALYDAMVSGAGELWPYFGTFIQTALMQATLNNTDDGTNWAYYPVFAQDEKGVDFNKIKFVRITKSNAIMYDREHKGFSVTWIHKEKFRIHDEKTNKSHDIDLSGFGNIARMHDFSQKLNDALCDARYENIKAAGSSTIFSEHAEMWKAMEKLATLMEKLHASAAFPASHSARAMVT